MIEDLNPRKQKIKSTKLRSSVEEKQVQNLRPINIKEGFIVIAGIFFHGISGSVVG